MCVCLCEIMWENICKIGCFWQAMGVSLAIKCVFICIFFQATRSSVSLKARHLVGLGYLPGSSVVGSLNTMILRRDITTCISDSFRQCLWSTGTLLHTPLSVLVVRVTRETTSLVILYPNVLRLCLGY